MLKNRKLSTRISLLTAVITLSCVAILFFIADNNMTEVITETVESNMLTSLDAKAQIIDEYIHNAETVLLSFSKSGELKNFLKDTKDAELKAVAQEYNEGFYGSISNWEGLYLDTWESEVITHSNSAVVGMVMREGDALKALQDGMLNSDPVYNIGIMASPASGNLVISMYTPVYEGKNPIGFVGGALMAAGMKDLLDIVEIQGLPNASYTLINVNTGEYIFDANEELINTEIEDTAILKVISEIGEGKEVGNINYKGADGKEYRSVYKSVPDRGWAVIIRDSIDEIYAPVKSSERVLGFACAIVAFLLV